MVGRKRQTTHAPAIVSARTYAWILANPGIRRALLPGDILSSPYEVLEYDATLTLHDPAGMRATFARQQRIRFLQDGVTAILDHAWGDGVVVTHYTNDAGHLEESFNDAGRRHLVIGLRRRMAQGDTLAFAVQRQAMVGFTQAEEWLETTIDHPVSRLRRTILFPKDRPCRRAVLDIAGHRLRLPISHRSAGTTMVRVAIAE